jgi:hypothetical protein
MDCLPIHIKNALKDSHEKGKLIYNAYRDSVKTTNDDKPLPDWKSLGERQRAGWCDAYECARNDSSCLTIKQNITLPSFSFPYITAQNN